MIVAILLLSEGEAVASSLVGARARTSLERRSTVALKKAESAFTAARDAYRARDSVSMAVSITDIGQYLDLAYTSLTETGKNPRESPKYFKQAEIKVRELARKLEYLQLEMPFDDQARLESVRTRVEQIDEDLLIDWSRAERKTGTCISRLRIEQ